MQLHYKEFSFTLLTPCFSGTALGKQADRAEMRIPPIRGHVRFWHRVLFGVGDCNRVWGAASGDQGYASRVSIRFVGLVPSVHAQPPPPVLPHKDKPNQRGHRPALAAGESFTLRLQRLPGCTDTDWDHAQKAVQLWLLIGGLGLRANRAAGSVWPKGNWVPKTGDDLKNLLQMLGLKKWCVALAGLGKGKSADELRATASDTIQGKSPRDIFGGINPRQPSNIKFKVIELADGLCLLASAQHVNIMRKAEQLLNQKPNATRWKALGAWNYIFP